MRIRGGSRYTVQVQAVNSSGLIKKAVFGKQTVVSNTASIKKGVKKNSHKESCKVKGASGKFKITANSQYKITGIIAVSVDKNGKYTYKKFKNGKKLTLSKDTYYQGVSSKKIYSDTSAADGWGSCVAATIKTGVDKKQYVYCQPRNVIKTTYSRQYKVLKTSKVISSVQLGKAKLTRADSNSAYSSSSSSSRAFLSGSSGKLTVKTADKNYSITSILVLTYDKEGKPVYTIVNNKKKINYGVNKSRRSNTYKSPYYAYSSNSVSLYKPTTVYVFYKNKFTGSFSRVNSISKDKSGNTVFSMTYRNAGDTKDITCTESSLYFYYNRDSYTFYKK